MLEHKHRRLIRGICSYCNENNTSNYDRAVQYILNLAKNGLTDELEVINNLCATHRRGYARQIIMNVNEYLTGLAFGFRSIAVDEIGWLEKRTFSIETIVLSDSAYNIIMLGKSPNGCYTYGLHCTFGSAGTAWNPSVFRKRFENRSDCLKAALLDMQQRFTNGLSKGDPMNYQAKVIKPVLFAIEKHLQEFEVSQPTLF